MGNSYDAFPSLQFQFSPVGYIADSRFTIAYYLLVFCVALYTFASYLFLHQYCGFTQAVAETAPWFSSARSADNVQSLPPYCNNAAYDWNLTAAQRAYLGDFHMVNISCDWLSDAVALQLSTSSMGIATNVFLLKNNGSQLEPHFMLDIESVRANFQHIVSLPSAPQELNPPTILVDANGHVMKSFEPAGEIVSLSLAEIFQAIGKNLDDDNFQPGGVPAVRFRNSGMLISVHLRYENAVDWQVGLRTRCVMSMKLMTGSWGPLGWVTVGATSYQRYGVVMTFTVEGQLGAFSGTAIVTQFISSLVLLGFCRTLVVMAVKFLSKLDATFAQTHQMELAPELFDRRYVASCATLPVTMVAASTSAPMIEEEKKYVTSVHVADVENPLRVMDVDDDAS